MLERRAEVPGRSAVCPEGDDVLADVLRFFVMGTRGGRTRARILELLVECPRNAHGLARDLGLNYGTVTTHLRVLERAGLVFPLTEGRYARGYAACGAARRNLTLLRGAHAPRRGPDPPPRRA